MQITDVRVRRLNTDSKKKAVASIVIDNEFAIHEIGVIESNGSTFISMPSRRTPNGEFKDIAHPISAEAREKIQSAVLEAYENAE